MKRWQDNPQLRELEAKIAATRERIEELRHTEENTAARIERGRQVLDDARAHAAIGKASRPSAKDAEVQLGELESFRVESKGKRLAAESELPVLNRALQITRLDLAAASCEEIHNEVATLVDEQARLMARSAEINDRLVALHQLAVSSFDAPGCEAVHVPPRGGFDLSLRSAVSAAGVRQWEEYARSQIESAKRQLAGRQAKRFRKVA